MAVVTVVPVAGLKHDCIKLVAPAALIHVARLVMPLGAVTVVATPAFWPPTIPVVVVYDEDDGVGPLAQKPAPSEYLIYNNNNNLISNILTLQILKK